MPNTMRILGRVARPGVMVVLTALTAVRGAAQAPTPGASVAGVVFDSLRGVGLAGAVVRVAGSKREVRTNARGEFVLDSLKPGEMTVEVRHPLLDTLGQSLDSRPFSLVSGQRGMYSARTMSLEDLRDRSCPRSGANFGRAILLGILRDADADTALAGGTASLVYKDQFSGASAERVRTSRIGADGRFAICGLPDAITGTVQVSRSGQVTAEVHVETKRTLFSTVGLTIATTTQRKAVLMGRVTQSSGLPIAGAQVVVAGSPNLARTDSLGRYRLEGLPSGTVEVVVRRIGFGAVTQAALLNQREPLRLDFTVSEARLLAAVKVVGKMDTGLDKVGFKERQMHGFGHFQSPDEIEQRHPFLFTDLLQVVPGLHISDRPGGRTIETTRPGGCVNFFIDNARFDSYEPGDIDSQFSTHIVGAVETYRSAAETPAQFQVPLKDCATVVMWTKDKLLRP
jgi:hypothetical protein